MPAVREVEGPFPGRPVVESDGRADVAPGPEPGVFAGGSVADGVTRAKGGARAFDIRSEPVRRACHRDAQTSSVATCAASTVAKGPTVVIGRPTCGGAYEARDASYERAASGVRRDTRHPRPHSR